jgi:AcrR family transcriptional regulator
MVDRNLNRRENLRISRYGCPVTARQGSADVRVRRADARSNHEQILAVARDVFVERGPGAPLDEIAKRAGVGIGTLYRHFADRQTLMLAVILDALVQTADAGERALAETPDAFGALTTYMHAVLDLRIAAVIPVLLEHVDLEGDELTSARDRGARALQQLVDAARARGSLTHDVTFGDIGLMLIRLSRPLPGRVPPELNAQLAHRHLDLLINGLKPAGAATLGGPALTLGDLRGLGPDAAQVKEDRDHGHQ